ncbi:hypothetical protein Clacol_002673 [Clathrus columnatus]|uniref:RRM domain-containing protein n=1 Tax=Clathrus columnatus TaxID=1419009 RepID=A0AAV5A977_9AGAM|nr:hypothetical protein Clacol_002673 [Clathrus columnatus]
MEIDTPAPSLLERMGEAKKGGGGGGGGRLFAAARRSASAPYLKRRDVLGSSNADADGVWKHDKHESVNGNGGSLAARLQVRSRDARPRPDLSMVESHIRKTITPGLSIKGASVPSEPIVEVKGLVAGTTPEDVKAIFQSCGPITKAKLASTATPQAPHVLLFYEKREDAMNAINKFNGLNADGQKLAVNLYTLEQKIQSSGKNEDLLLQNEPSGGRMYSDQIAAMDPRAQIVIGDFTPDSSSTRPGRGRGGRRGGRGGRRGGKMEID